jgi:molybdenum cofactor biosynthesis enzyme
VTEIYAQLKAMPIAKAQMVDITHKIITLRTATAQAIKSKIARNDESDIDKQCLKAML